jgi:hypothetical protein
LRREVTKLVEEIMSEKNERLQGGYLSPPMPKITGSTASDEPKKLDNCQPRPQQKTQERQREKGINHE